jgi:hypothetical protein
MGTELQLVASALLSLLYVVVARLRAGPGPKACVKSDGPWANPWTVGALAVLAVIAYAALRLIPTEITRGLSPYTGVWLTTSSLNRMLIEESLYLALWEEIFFWLGEVSYDKGLTWTVKQEVRTKRRAPVLAPSTDA